jgi:FMN phosphatase YigB (HAD superfamily)
MTMNREVGKTKAIIFDFNRTLYDPDSRALFEGVHDLLETLNRHYHLFLMGKGSIDRQNLITELGLGPYFEDIVVKEEKYLEDFEFLRSKHPAAEYYSVGDRIKKEIKFSNLNGMKTIWFKNGKFAGEGPDLEIEQPWKTITNLQELLGILEP